MMFVLALAQGLPYYVEAQRAAQVAADGAAEPGPGPDRRRPP